MRSTTVRYLNNSLIIRTTGRLYYSDKQYSGRLPPFRSSSSQRLSCLHTRVRILPPRRRTGNGVLSKPHVCNQRSYHAAIGMGSNLGDKVQNIESALREMSKRGLNILGLSRLYETAPMYYEDQDCFVNGACHVETTLNPHELLHLLQAIENDLGRVRKIDKGPRTVDLDILLYDDLHLVSHDLEVPHKLMLERAFVLFPLADILPEYKLPDTFLSATPTSASTIGHFRQRIQNKADVEKMPYITRISSRTRDLYPGGEKSTLLMAILNITPDSFSDGGALSEANIDQVCKTVRKHIESGAVILDVGGQSTRPGAQHVDKKEELRRVIPVIEAIRSMPEAAHVAISIDTFYADVARHAINTGGDIINDVTAGQFDSEMLSTVAKLEKSIVLMHMRGDPNTMQKHAEYPQGVCTEVAEELAARVKDARDAGIPPWRIILDPGIGFAKNGQQNIELLRNLGTLRRRPEFQGLPWLVGVSRKKFIGDITGVEMARERVWGTAAAVATAIAEGCDIIRVHDTMEMGQVAKMADAIYRADR